MKKELIYIVEWAGHCDLASFHNLAKASRYLETEYESIFSEEYDPTNNNGELRIKTLTYR